jgi:hypothetical protein
MYRIYVEKYLAWRNPTGMERMGVAGVSNYSSLKRIDQVYITYTMTSTYETQSFGLSTTIYLVELPVPIRELRCDTM